MMKRRFVPRNSQQMAQLPDKEPVNQWNSDHLYESIVHKPSCLTNFLHIIITSAADHQKERDVIRQTWCSSLQLIQPFLPPNSSVLIQCTFLIGQSSHLTTMQHIQDEIKTYNDILLGDYLDTYRNLTLKVLTGLHWSAKDCSSQYTLKTDDDCFVNSNVLLKVLLSQSDKRSHKSMYIGLNLDSLEHITVIRDPRSKWAVSIEEYAADYYPSYISGTGYLLSKYSTKQIVELSRHHVPFPVEDAYIGVLAEKAGIKPEHSYRFTLVTQMWRTCNFLYLILMHHVSRERQVEFQNLVKQAYTECGGQALTMKW